MDAFAIYKTIRRAAQEYGWPNLFLLAANRGLDGLSRSRIERFYLVAQPVPESLSLSRGQSIEVRAILKGDPQLDQFIRSAGEINDRFDQGAICFGAFCGGELWGWIWLAFREFREFHDPLTFVLPASGRVSWDLDVFVRPDRRLRPVLPRLWQAANDELRARGVHWTTSMISAFNPASLNVHRRLGAKTLGSVGILRLGSLQLVLGGKFGARLAWSSRKDFRAVIRIPDIEANTKAKIG